MNQPEGYVLVQVKQLAQWREWANNVAAWSKQADRSSEVARLKSSISSAMISATLPPASAAGDCGAGERAILEQIALEEKAMNQADADGRHLNAQGHGQAIEAYKFCLAAIATKPQAEQEATPPAQTVQDREPGFVKPDTDRQVFFYEQDFYVLSNFSAFTLNWRGERFDTSEAAYHFEKFPRDQGIRTQILRAPSAHEAFKIAARYKKDRRPDWDSVKVDIMRAILRAKVAQHEYVRRKLLGTGDRELIEDSWRDGYWGWGPDRKGQNMLGKLWMELRAELRAARTRGDEVGKSS